MFLYFLSPLCVFQWKREQDFDLQLLERAVQGEEAQGVRSVQGEERPPEHKERPRSQSDEWLTFRSMASTPPAPEADLEPLDYDVDLNKEASYLFNDSMEMIIIAHTRNNLQRSEDNDVEGKNLHSHP